MAADLVPRFRQLLPAALIIVCFYLVPAMAEEEARVGVEVIAILNSDEQGKRLRYPSSVSYDPETEETYVVVGGEGKVIVYGANFFPIVSLSKGRGGDAPRGVYIDPSSGMIYLCQGRTAERPGRITSFNPAFFPEKEIVFTSMPEGENFIPKSMVKGLAGTMYVVGLNSRGVLVLDSEGTFSHWLKPMDQLFSESSSEETLAIGSMESQTEIVSEVAASGETAPEKINMRDLLPPGLLPQIEGETTTAILSEPQPVQIADIKVDSSGRLYILSEETSKTYVYSKDEEFLFSFGLKGGSTGKMSRPRSLAIDEKKKAVYIVDYMRHTILIFDLAGKFMYEFGGMGTGPGWFQFPTWLALNTKGHLIVADLFNQRVQILDVKFEYKYPLSATPDEKPDVIDAMPEEEIQTPAPVEEGEEEDIFLPLPLSLPLPAANL